MISHPLLSNDEYCYISSQKSKHASNFNKSQMRKRIKEKVEKTYKTFEAIYISKELDQNFKNDLFSDEKIKRLAEVFTIYDKSNPIANEQSIARALVEAGFNYYKQRYEPINFIENEIEKIEGLLRVLEFQAQEEDRESKGMEMYRLRSKNKKPPTIIPEKDFWIAECIHCYAVSQHHNETKKEAIKNIRHEKGCSFLTDLKAGRKNKEITKEQYLRIFPPRDLKNTN